MTAAGSAHSDQSTNDACTCGLYRTQPIPASYVEVQVDEGGAMMRAFRRSTLGSGGSIE